MKRKWFTAPRFGMYFMFFIGCLILYKGVLSLRFAQDLTHNGIAAKALVTSVIHKQSKYPSTIYYATFRVGKADYVATNNFITNDSRYAVGDTIDIFYQKQNPDVSIINDDYEQNEWAITIAVGFIIILLSAFLVVYIKS